MVGRGVEVLERGKLAVRDRDETPRGESRLREGTVRVWVNARETASVRVQGINIGLTGTTHMKCSTWSRSAWRRNASCGLL